MPDLGDDLNGGWRNPGLDRVLLKEFGGEFRLRTGRSWARPEFGPCFYGNFVRSPTGVRIVVQVAPSRGAQLISVAFAVFLLLSAAVFALFAYAHETTWVLAFAPLALLGLGAEAFRRHWLGRFPKRRRLSEFVESVFEASPR